MSNRINQNNNNQSNNETSFNWATAFLCRVGGANLEILSKHPLDKRRFLVVGLLICMTSLMALITMSFAIDAMLAQSLMANKSIIIFLGAFAWAIIIFIIDFSLINTMKTLPFEFSWNWITQIIIPTTIRLCIAGLISFTISKPLEVWYFKEVMKPYIPSIRDQQILRDRKTGLLSTEKVEKDITKLSQKDSINRVDEKNDPRIKSLEEDIKENEKKITRETDNLPSIRARIAELEDKCKGVEEICSYNSDIAGLKARKNGIGNEIERLSQSNKVKKDEIKGINENYFTERKKIGKDAESPLAEKKLKDSIRLHNERVADSLYHEVYNPHNPPLNVSLTTLDKMKQDSDFGKAIADTSLLFLLIILVIDILPIIIKLFTNKIGNYEREIVTREREQKNLLREEYKINKMVANSIASAQREIIKDALNKYKETEKDRIENEPQAYRDYFSSNQDNNTA